MLINKRSMLDWAGLGWVGEGRAGLGWTVAREILKAFQSWGSVLASGGSKL